MNLRYLITRLLGNDQVIKKLADSYPVRRAAKFSVSVWLRSKDLGSDGLEKFMESDAAEKVKGGAKDTTVRLNSFKDRFKQNLDTELKDLEKRRRRK